MESTTSIVEPEGELISESFTSKWRDVRAYLASCGDFFPELPGMSEIGSQVLSALTCERKGTDAGKPLELANFNSASQDEQQQDSLFQNLLAYMPGVRLEHINSGIKVTRYSLELTSSIGRQVLRFTRSLVPSKDTPQDTPERIIYSVASSTDQPLP